MGPPNSSTEPQMASKQARRRRIFIFALPRAAVLVGVRMVPLDFLMRIPLLVVCACLSITAVPTEAALPTISTPEFKPTTPANGTGTIVTTIDPGNQLTEVTLKYGLGNKLVEKAVESVPGDAIKREVPFPLTALVGGKTYHYEITARNASSGKLGVEKSGTFASGPYPPTAEALPATGIKGGAVTLNGTVTSNQSVPTTVTAFFRFQTTPGVPVTAERLSPQ